MAVSNEVEENRESLTVQWARHGRHILVSVDNSSEVDLPVAHSFLQDRRNSERL